MASTFSPSFSHFTTRHIHPLSPTTTYRLKVTNFTAKLRRNPRLVLPFVCNSLVFSFQDGEKCFKDEHKLSQELPTCLEQEKDPLLSSWYWSKTRNSTSQCISRSAAYALFCVAIGICLSGLSPAHAVGPTVVSEITVGKKENEFDMESNVKRHKYSEYTRRLLEEVSRLLKCVEEARNGNGGVEEAKLELKAVKEKKEGLQMEIMEGLYGVLRELRIEKGSLVKRADEIVDEMLKLRPEYESQCKKSGKETIENMEERMQVMEEEYSGIWKRVGEIEDEISRRETMALNIGVRELCFIERECEELVKRFGHEMRQRETDG